MAFAQTIIGLFITADRNALAVIMGVFFFLSIALVALLARRRRWPEIVCLFFVIYALSLGAAHIFFAHVVDLPFLKMEPVSVSTD